MRTSSYLSSTLRFKASKLKSQSRCERNTAYSEMQRRQPDFFSEIEEIRSEIESDAEQGSIVVGSWDSFSNIKTTLEYRLNAVVGGRLGTKTLSRVRKYTIADWLVRCPLRFKRKRTLQ